MRTIYALIVAICITTTASAQQRVCTPQGCYYLPSRKVEGQPVRNVVRSVMPAPKVQYVVPSSYYVPASQPVLTYNRSESCPTNCPANCACGCQAPSYSTVISSSPQRYIFRRARQRVLFPRLRNLFSRIRYGRY